MIRKWILFVLICITSGAAIFYYSLRTKNQIWNVNSIDSMTLYSVDGTTSSKSGFKPDENQELFHGIPVLGKIKLEKNQRNELVNALNKGIADGNSLAACFWPRHAIRIEREGQVSDYVICFYCYQIKKFTDQSTETISTTRFPKTVFNEILTNAGIELAPEN